MRLNPNSWHVKWYFLSTTLFEAWKDTSFPPEFDGPIHTNLCPYMRRLLITFPLLLVFYGCVAWFIIYSTVIYPATHIGWGFFEFIGLSLLVGAAFIGLVLGIAKVFPSVASFCVKYIGGPISDFFVYVSDKVGDCIMGTEEAPSFCAVLRQWIIDSHHMICRDLTIGEEKAHDL